VLAVQRDVKTRSFPALAGILVSIFFVAGCAPTVRSASSAAAKGAVPAAAESSLSLMEDPQTRQRVVSALETPEMQRALQDLSAGLTQGVVKGLASDEMNAHVQKMVGQFLRAFMVELARGMNDVASGAVDSAFAAAMSPQHKQQLEQFTAAIMGSVMRGAAQEIPSAFGPALHKTMVDDVGPALAEMMHKDFAPGMAAMIKSPDFKAALGETAREVAHQAVLGSNEGLAELSEKRKNDAGGMPLGVVGAFFAGRTWLLGALVVAAMFSVPLLWLIRDRRQARRFREEAERRNARAAALLGAMEAAPDGQWSSHMLRMLREQLLEEATNATEDKMDVAPRSGPPRPRHA